MMAGSSSTGSAVEPRVLIATGESITRCATCRAYRRATLEGRNFLLYWCGRCASRLVLRRLAGPWGLAAASTHLVTRHARDERLHLFETDAGQLLVFLRPATPRP
jgi:hypothetical protein